MTDSDNRALVRRAESTRAGDDWLRAAWALARAQSWDEAGDAAARAQAAGTDAGEVLDAMTPPLEAFTARTVGEPHPRALAHPVFSWSGRELLGLDRTSVVSIDLTTGERRTLGDVACAIDRWGRAEAGPMATSPQGDSIAVGFKRARGKWCVGLVRDGASSDQIPIVVQGIEAVTSLASTGESLGVCSAESGSGRSVHLSLAATSVPTSRTAAHKSKGIAVVPVLDRSGAAVELDADGERVWLRRSLVAEPHACATVGKVAAAARPVALHPAGFRLVAVSSNVRLFASDGALVATGRAPFDGGLADHSWAAPSGRVVALGWMGVESGIGSRGSGVWRRVDLLDLARGESRTLALEETPEPRRFSLAWSPSGRKLAVTSSGESVLLWEAPS